MQCKCTSNAVDSVTCMCVDMIVVVNELFTLRVVGVHKATLA